jgi:hypothetical protein
LEKRKVPKAPFILSATGILMMFGPQAINFGLSVGGGETMLIPYCAAIGGTPLFWLMTLSTIFETALVYECIKYSMITGRSFFVATRDIPPKGFWPWFWVAEVLFAIWWPSWLAGAASAIYKLSGFASFYFWCALALTILIIVFVFAKYIYNVIEKFFMFIFIFNMIFAVAVAALVATPSDVVEVFKGYFNFGLLGWPEKFPIGLAASLIQQPGGSAMWVAWWILEAGFAMGIYHGKVTGPLRPPEEITVEEIPWDVNDPEEVSKMKEWLRLGKWGLIIFWSIIGAIVGTFLYALMGYSYLFKRGIVASGLDVPLQVATVAEGILGPTAGIIMLIFIALTLYDAEFGYYDVMGRVVADAVATTPKVRGKRPYRFYYFLAAILSILAGYYLVTIAMPFTLWLISSFAALLLKCFGMPQILYINLKRLPKQFRPAWYTIVILVVGTIMSTLFAILWGLSYFKII